MKKKDIKVGETYLAKVSGKVVPVRITNESEYGGWNAINTTTGREVRIRSAARLRRPMETRTCLVPSARKDDQLAPVPCDADLKFLEFPSAIEAVQRAKADGGKAIRMGGRNLVTSEADAQQLAAHGAEFAYLCEHKGRIVTVPANN